MTTETQDSDTPKQQRNYKKHAWCILIALILLLTIAFLAWQLTQSREQARKIEAEKKALLSKVTPPTETPTATTTAPTPTPPATCSDTVSEAVKTAIRNALETKDYTTLGVHMTPSVNVVLAASEKGGEVPQATAITDLKYLDSATLPWNFSLSAATIASYEAHFYAPYFDDNTYAGKSANDLVVSFDFDSCSKINKVFISASEDILLM